MFTERIVTTPLTSPFIPGFSDLQLRQHLSFSEDSDLSSDDILERSSQKSKREVGRWEMHFRWI